MSIIKLYQRIKMRLVIIFNKCRKKRLYISHTCSFLWSNISKFQNYRPKKQQQQQQHLLLYTQHAYLALGNTRKELTPLQTLMLLKGRNLRTRSIFLSKEPSSSILFLFLLDRLSLRIRLCSINLILVKENKKKKNQN